MRLRQMKNKILRYAELELKYQRSKSLSNEELEEMRKLLSETGMSREAILIKAKEFIVED